jgi:ribosomal protein S18 acetylase RimI-like enzyme
MERITIRPAALGDEEGLAYVHVRSWQTAYRDILPDQFLEGLSVPAHVERWRERIANPGEGEFSIVAEAIGADRQRAVIGFAGGGPERDGFADVNGARYDGEIYAIYLLAEWRSRGIGHQLMAPAAQALIGHGFRSVVIWVLKENANARHFYEALGGLLVGEKPITIGQTELLEVAYGWSDARRLLEAASRVR